MKLTELHLAAFLIIQVLIPDLYAKCFFSVLIVVISFVFQRKLLLLTVIIFLSTFFHSYLYNTLPQSNTYQVSEVHEKYVIVTAAGRNVMVYGTELQLDDIISFTALPKPIKTVRTFYSNSYQNWLLRKRINYSVNSKDIEIVKHNNTLAKQFRKRVDDISNVEVKEILQKIFFGVNSDNLQYYMLSSSVGLLSGYYLYKRIFSIFCNEKVMKILSVLYLFFLVVFLRQWLIFIRILLSEFILKQEKDKYRRLAWSIIIPLVISSFYLYHPAFYLPLLFRVYSLFVNDKNKIKQLLLIIPFYLRTQYRLNFLQLFLYHYNRSYLGAITLLGLFCVMCGSDVFLRWVVLINEKALPSLLISGQMNIMLTAIWYLLLYFDFREVKRYIIMVLILTYINYQSLFNPFYEVTQLYIGQGDATVIRFPFSEKVMLVDVGSERNYNYLRQFLNAHSIKEVDVLLLSHDDEDHSGGYEHLIKDFPVNQLISSEEELLYQNTYWYFLNQKKIYDNENDNSTVLYFSLNNLNYLYLGDISTAIEEKLLKEYHNLEPQIVKIAHHGSKTSTSMRLLGSRSLQLAIISSGLNNQYHHPSYEVLEKLEKARILYFDTQSEGDIQIKGLLYFNFLLTSRGRFVIM